MQVKLADRDAFEVMAMSYFRELNPNFIPSADWRGHYFDRIIKSADLSLLWVTQDMLQAGFILFGIEQHPFLPRTNGVIYELYIAPEFRRRGFAKACARLAVKELSSQGTSKIQLEITQGNRAATAFWATLGFEKIAERWALRKEAQ